MGAAINVDGFWKVIGCFPFFRGFTISVYFCKHFCNCIWHANFTYKNIANLLRYTAEQNLIRLNNEQSMKWIVTYWKCRLHAKYWGKSKNSIFVIPARKLRFYALYAVERRTSFRPRVKTKSLRWKQTSHTAHVQMLWMTVFVQVMTKK